MLRGSQSLNDRPARGAAARTLPAWIVRALVRCACAAVACALGACEQRPADAVDRWAAWEQARELVFVVPEERRGEALRELPRLRRRFAKELRLATGIDPADEALPRLVWNEFAAPLARPALAWTEPREIDAALRAFASSARDETPVVWAWGGAERGLARRFLLVAQSLDEVPWDLVRLERHSSAGIQGFRRGELRWQADLLTRAGAHEIDHRTRFEADLPPLGSRSWNMPGFRLEAAELPSPEQRLALARVLRALRDPFAVAGAERPPVRIVLHRDPQAMRRACGRIALQRFQPASRTVHWLVGEEPFALPPLFELQKLLLEDSSPPDAASWWLEGLAAMLQADAGEASWIEALPLLATEPQPVRARQLFDERRFAELPAWQRRASAALLLWQALAAGIDLRTLASVRAETPGWPWIADRVLEHWTAVFALRARRVGEHRTSRFSRIVSIEPRFPEGYFDARFRLALERARRIGFDTVLLIARGRPLSQEASSRLDPCAGSFDEIAWAAAEARRLGLRVRLRLRYQEVRLGAFFGGIWRERGNFWIHGLERLDRWVREQAFASRGLDLEALHFGFEFHGVFEPTTRRPERLVVPLQHLVARLDASAGAPVIFEFKLRERLDTATFLMPGDAISVGTRDFFRGLEHLFDHPPSASLEPRRWRTSALKPSILLAERAHRDRLARLELSIGIHGHGRAARHPQWPLPGPAPGLRATLLDIALRSALANPAVRGVLVEGGELEGDHAPLELGFADPEVEEQLRLRLAVPSARELLAWILPLAG